jgi:hypothetical protein
VQLLIDSSAQKLEDVLNVIGAMYGVEIAVPATAASPRKEVSRRGPAKTTPRRKRRRRSSASSADIRTWAQSNGHRVADRGRIPASIVEAFEVSMEPALP